MGSIIRRARTLTRERRLIQSATLIFLNLPFVHLLMISCPVFYCHGCPLASMACPLGVLVNFSTLRVFPFVTLGILGLVGTIGGRLVCGWLCPFGFIQDLLHKIPSKKISINPKFYYTKYILLVGLVFAVPYFFPGKPYTFCQFCPSGTMESAIPWQFMGEAFESGVPAFILRITILLGVLALGVVASRSWCRVFCPLGAIFAFFNRFSIFRFRLEYDKCKNCGLCASKCPVDIDPVKQMNTAECIRCMDCTCTKHIKLGTK